MVHKGGISAVAIATPKITEAMVPFLVRAMASAAPPKKAIKTSLISGWVRAKSSDDSCCSGKNKKKTVAVTALSSTITIKFCVADLIMSKSLMANPTPVPSTGPISGAISMAPITTAVESVFKPIQAIKTEHISTQAVAPLKGMSWRTASNVAA